MRRQQMLKAQSTHASLCIFCASRSLAQPLLHSHLVGRLQQRHLKTALPHYQSAAAATAAAAAPSPTPPSDTWDAEHTLTAAELASKQRRQAQERERNLAQQRETQRLSDQEREAWHRERLEAAHRARETGAHQSQRGVRYEGNGVRQEWRRRKQEPQRMAGRLQGESARLFGGEQRGQRRTSAGNGDVFGTPDQVYNTQPSVPQQRRNGESPFDDPTQAPRRPQEQTNPFHPESEYRATPFDPFEHQSQQTRKPPTSNAPQENQWQHLPIRRPNSTALPPSQPPSQSQRVQPPPPPDDAWIDSQFRNHQRTRPPPPPTPYSNPNIVTRTAFTAGAETPPSQKKCARCLEIGHTARECTSKAATGTCNICGQPGHWARECPNNFLNARDGGTRHSRVVGDVFSGHESNTCRSTGSDTNGATELETRFSPFHGGDAAGKRSAHRRSEEHSTGGAVSSTRGVEDSRPVGSDRFSTPPLERQDDPGGNERRARRSGRGIFEHEASAEEEAADRRSRRQSRRSMAVRDDEKDDDAAAQREERAARKSARKAAKKAERSAERLEKGPPISLPDFISISNLAQALNVRYESFISRLEKLGYDDIFPGKVLNSEMSGMIAMEYGFDPIFEDSASTGKTEDEERDIHACPQPEGEDKMFLPTRPPVVTIMGHVDHGKTTILDYLRKSAVAAGEAGGITQHIGAFSVPLAASGKTITFLDTPGHAAFLSMRQRGANVTDLVVLVVAADDSVKPQTLESLRCARSAGVPIIVAISKVDKPEADVERVKQDLARHGVEIEDFGGETQVVCVSGKTGEGIAELEEAALTLAEILDCRADVAGEVEGWVLEASVKKAGRVATILVKRGTLRPGMVIVAGKTWARVRTLRNEAGVLAQEIGPGMAVEVDGWRDQPVAGDEVLQAGSEQKAGDVVEYRIEKEEREKTAQDMEAINEARRLEQERRVREKNKAAPEDASAAAPPATTSEEEPAHQNVALIIKADVSGSAEAVSAYIPSLTSPLISPQILSSAVGSVNESDIELAAAAQGHIIAFNLPPNADAKAAAEARGVKVLENNIIYRVLDDVKGVMEERLPPLITQRVLGEAEVGAKFEIGLGGRKKMWIAGCKVRNGVVGRGARVRVLRAGEKVYDGTVSSLKNVKKDVQDMRKGSECGMGFEEWESFEVGDLVQTYEETSEKRRL